MIDSIKLAGYGPINNLEWYGLKSINLIIGQNASGKTITQKALNKVANKLLPKMVLHKNKNHKVIIKALPFL